MKEPIGWHRITTESVSLSATGTEIAAGLSTIIGGTKIVTGTSTMKITTTAINMTRVTITIMGAVVGVDTITTTNRPAQCFLGDFRPVRCDEGIDRGCASGSVVRAGGRL